jgi:hypothetical protein
VITAARHLPRWLVGVLARLGAVFAYITERKRI